jgi:hypothetical protein
MPKTPKLRLVTEQSGTFGRAFRPNVFESELEVLRIVTIFGSPLVLEQATLMSSE